MVVGCESQRITYVSLLLADGFRCFDRGTAWHSQSHITHTYIYIYVYPSSIMFLYVEQSDIGKGGNTRFGSFTDG